MFSTRPITGVLRISFAIVMDLATTNCDTPEGIVTMIVPASCGSRSTRLGSLSVPGGRSITMAKEIVKRPLIGLVENMAAYVCAHCGQEEALFPVGHVEELAAEHEVPYLGRIPFDPRLAAAADDGMLFMQHHLETPAGQAIAHVAAQMRAFLG